MLLRGNVCTILSKIRRPSSLLPMAYYSSLQKIIFGDGDITKDFKNMFFIFRRYNGISIFSRSFLAPSYTFTVTTYYHTTPKAFLCIISKQTSLVSFGVLIVLYISKGAYLIDINNLHLQRNEI